MFKLVEGPAHVGQNKLICAVCSRPARLPSSAMPKSTAPNIGLVPDRASYASFRKSAVCICCGRNFASPAVSKIDQTLFRAFGKIVWSWIPVLRQNPGSSGFPPRPPPPPPPPGDRGISLIRATDKSRRVIRAERNFAALHALGFAGRRGLS